MHFKHLLCSATLAFQLVAPATASVVVQGTMTSEDYFLGYMGVMTDISTLAGQEMLPTSGFAFCLEHSRHFPGWDAPHQYTLDDFATFLDTPQTADKATAMLHYLVDRYYAPLMQGQFGMQSGYGFNQAVWQLIGFDGTQASMGVVADDDGKDLRGDHALYATVMGDLHDNFASIAPGYRSTRYDIRFLKEHDGEYQSLALVTDRGHAVPEPSTLLLALASGAGIAIVRTRRHRGEGPAGSSGGAGKDARGSSPLS